MPQDPDIPATSVLLIDSSKNQRIYWADQLKRCSADYEIFEASDGESARAVYHSRRIDCVVLELSLATQSGFEVLMKLIPIPSRPNVAVVVLTLMTHPGIWELAKENAAHTCLGKKFTTGEDLDRAIQLRWRLLDRCPRKIGTGHSDASFWLASDDALSYAPNQP
jgi:response regulator RpfG family c-di-GMP phosphodiesterase